MGTRKTMLECHAQGACEAYDANGNPDPSKDMANGSSRLVKTEAVGLLSGNIKAAGNLDISGFATVNNTSAAGSIAGGAPLATAPATNDPTTALDGLTAGGALFTPNAAIGGLSANGTPLAGADLIAALGNSAPKPNSGGFGGTIPGQIFLYENRAEFLDVSKFYGSGYFIDRIGYKPDRQVPFLGDAYFENELVDQQLRQLVNQGLGKGSFIPGSDAIEQMKTLLDRGVDFAREHGLAIGEQLSPELVANLTETLVWYEKKTVNGIEVLVPTVYVANTDKANLTVAGAIISGGSVNMNVAEVNNSGMIAAKTDLRLAATNINATGGSFNAGGGLSLSATQNITLTAQSVDVGGESVVNPNAMVTAGGSAALQAGETLKLTGAGVEVGGDALLSAKNVTLDAQKVENNGSQNATGARVDAGGNMLIQAENDVTIIGSSAKAGGALGVSAENGSVNIVTTDVTRQTSDGYSKSTTTTQQASQLSSGGDMVIGAQKDVLVSGSSVNAGGDAAIAAGGNVNITTAQEKGAVTFGTNSGETTTHQGSQINAKGDIAVSAGGNGTGNLNIVGSQIAADEKVNLKAADDITIAEARDSESYKFAAKSGKGATTKATLDRETAIGSSISGGAGVNMASGGDTTISASQIQAGTKDNKADLNIKTGGDLVIASGKNVTDEEIDSKQKGFLSKKQWSWDVYNETTVGSELGASGNVNLNAADNVAISGSKVNAGEAINIEGDSVSIIGAQKTDAEASSKKKSGLFAGSGDGFFSLWGKEEKSKQEGIVSNVGSQLSGTDVNIKARETDVNIVGSDIQAERDIALDAARDVNVLPGAESYASEEKEKRSGFGVQVGSTNGGFSLGVGYAKSSDETRQGAETNAASSLNAGRDIKIDAGRDANLQAAQIEAERNVAIAAERDVNLLAAQDVSNYEHIHKELFAGITAQVSSGLVSAAQGAAESMQAAGSASGGAQALANAAMAALYANKLQQGLEAANQNGKTGVSASVSIGFQSSKTEERSESSTPVVTNIRAGDSVTIDANSGDINSHGAQIIAGYDQYGLPTGGSGDITFNAGNNINLGSAVATGSNASKNSSFGASVGIGGGFTVGADGAINPVQGSAGISVSANGSKGSANQNATTHVNTHVAGAGTVTLNSNKDTNLKGAVVSGETVKANVGGDLNIESQVDTASSNAKQTSVGGSVGTGGFNVSGSYQNAKGDAVVVSEQSGIHAGSGGFQIDVEGKTKLEGGLITSEAPAKDNRLETGTLEFADIDTHSKWKAETWGGSVGSGGISMAPPIKEGESETGKALSAVSPGQIVITDPAKQQQNVDDLLRDTTNTNTSLPGLPDLQKILGEQYKTQARYQEASAMMAEFVGDMADKLALEALAKGDLKTA